MNNPLQKNPPHNWRVDTAGHASRDFATCTEAIAFASQYINAGYKSYVKDLAHGWYMWPATDYIHS